MENIKKSNQNHEALPSSALFLDKIHSCTDCPIRKAAIKQPKSIFAKIHAWHMTWWPGYKAHQARTCAFAARAGSKA